MNKFKKAVITAAVMILILVAAFVRGGNAPTVSNTQQTYVSQQQKTDNAIQPSNETQQISDDSAEQTSETDVQRTTKNDSDKTAPKAEQPQSQRAQAEQSLPEQTVSHNQSVTDDAASAQAFDDTNDQTANGQPQTAETAKINDEVSQQNNDEISQLTCTLSVTCGTILNNMSWLDEAKHSLVPADGVIYPPHTVPFTNGESVFDVLHRAMKDAKIHFEFVSTPAYDSVYIEGINNLYEFDCGELSGWMYKVNGEFPGYGCSGYQLRDGDNIEFVYTCDLGEDVGNKYKKSGNN